MEGFQEDLNDLVKEHGITVVAVLSQSPTALSARIQMRDIQDQLEEDDEDNLVQPQDEESTNDNDTGEAIVAGGEAE